MFYFFSIAFSEFGLGKIEIVIIGLVAIIFPVLFILASRNLDAKGVFEWMMEKPDDWIGKK
tara:strand:- start:15207 stop:15389 length:183 start_codon:yes stop_codon:yes gene_type:complete